MKEAEKSKSDSSNAFDDLLEALISGELGHNQIQIAYCAWIKQSKEIPTGVKNLLGRTNLLFDHFNLISETIEKMQLAYRLGYVEGQKSRDSSSPPLAEVNNA